MKWKQKNANVHNLDEYVKDCTGQSYNDLLPNVSKQYHTKSLEKAAMMIREAIKAGRTIQIVPDFDADGLDSLCILYLLLKHFGAKIAMSIPRRFSDGYGMHEDMLKRFAPNAFVITVDNGIAEKDVIAKAKAMGMDVLILDHHNAPDSIPEADLIIDPEVTATPKHPEYAVFSAGWDYTHYCGAGLSYKLAQEMLGEEDKTLLDYMSCFAAIATMADVVDVTGDNRNIISQGIANMRAGNCMPGLKALLDVLVKHEKLRGPITPEDLAFQIAPIINTPGRMYDDGGKKVISCFMAPYEKAVGMAEELLALNETKKELVTNVISDMEPKGTNIRFLYNSTIPEGICGIIAGRYLEETGCPSFVMTQSMKGGIKGSARSALPNKVFDMMKPIEDYFEAFGGHDCAAGFTVKPDKMDAFFEAMEKAAVPAEEVKYYDFDCPVTELMNEYVQENRMEIFGEGLKKPILHVTGMISNVRVIGKDQNHLSFDIGGVKCIAFQMAQQYKDMGSPSLVDLYGQIKANWFRGRATAQLEIKDIKSPMQAD